ncbi:MAG: hypothetical protein J07HX64_01916 [halophilic archaeon J07HX64]|jgi:conserved hypothetical protein|nr:MAG: hypothetical protein J07HX64_01916 [halophilic archaeon J07HX64]
MARRAVRLRHAATLTGTLLVVGGGAVLAARTVDLGRAVETVRTADPVVLALASVVYLLSWPLRGHRYGDVLAAVGHRCGTGFLTATVFVSQAVNLVVPARAGDGVRAYLLNTRRKVPYTTGVSSLAVERLFDLLSLAALGGGALAVLALAGEHTAGGERFLAGASVVALGGVLAAGTAVTVAHSDRRPGAWLRGRVRRRRLRAVVDAAAGVGTDLRVVATDGRTLLWVAAGSLAVWAIDVLTAVLVLVALADLNLSLPVLVCVGTLAVTVGNLAKVLPLSQGGIGLYEAAFTALVVAVSPVGAATALAAAVLDHALKNLVTVVGGTAAALALNLSPGTFRRSEHSES